MSAIDILIVLVIVFGSTGTLRFIIGGVNEDDATIGNAIADWVALIIVILLLIGTSL